MLRELLFFFELCTNLASASIDDDNLSQSDEVTSNSGEPRNIKLYIIIGSSCGGLIIIIGVVLAVWGLYRYAQIRKRNKVRNEIIDYFRDVKNSEVCRHCWGRQANVYCEDCSKHYFCIVCSDHVHNVYKDKRCCMTFRKSLYEHNISNATWPTESQVQTPASMKPADAQINEKEEDEALAGMQDDKRYKTFEIETHDDAVAARGSNSINDDSKEPLLARHNEHKLASSQQYSVSLNQSPLTSSYTSLNSLLGFENDD